MKKNNQLILLQLRADNIDVFRILYDKIKNVPNILELVDKSNNNGTLLYWLCRLNLNDLLRDCFDKINPMNVDTKDSKGYTPLIYMIVNAREKLDTYNILLRFLTKYHKEQRLDRELLLCVDKMIRNDVLIPPNFELLNKIIDIYKDDEEDLLVYDSILNSEILYKKIYNDSEQRNINLIFEKISKKNESFEDTNIMINVLKFNNQNIFNIIIKNPKIGKLSIKKISDTIIGQIFLLFQFDTIVNQLIKKSEINQAEINCIYNKIITSSSNIYLATFGYSYTFPKYDLINFLWKNSNRKQETFVYVNNNTLQKYITEFGYLKNDAETYSIIRRFIEPNMCNTRIVEYDDYDIEDPDLKNKNDWIEKHIADPTIISDESIHINYLIGTIGSCYYIFYCYDYTRHKLISIGTILKSDDNQSYELKGLCVDSKYPGLGTSFMNYIKKITKQLNQNKETKLQLFATERYETLKFYKEKAGFDFTNKDEHGKAELEEEGLFKMDVTYKKYLKYKAKYMNLRKKLSN